MKNSKQTFAIIVAEFNKDITEAMVMAACDEAAALGVTVPPVLRVPGSYELPLIANELLKDPQISGVVVLGYIERGETLHGEVMGHTVHGCLLKASLEHRKPVGLGIIGPGAVVTQAEERKESYARAAVRAAVASARVLMKIPKRGSPSNESRGRRSGSPGSHAKTGRNPNK